MKTKIKSNSIYKILFVFIIFLSINTVNAYAYTDEISGIKVDVLEDKESGSKKGFVNLRINIENTSDKDITNLSVVANFPEKLETNSVDLDFNKSKLSAHKNFYSIVEIKMKDPLIIGLFIVLIIVLILILVLLIIQYRNIKAYNIANGFIILILITSLISPIITNASDARRSFDVKDSIEIKGKTYDYTIKISYDYE